MLLEIGRHISLRLHFKTKIYTHATAVVHSTFPETSGTFLSAVFLHILIYFSYKFFLPNAILLTYFSLSKYGPNRHFIVYIEKFYVVNFVLLISRSSI